MASTPQEELAKVDHSSRVKVTVLCIICAVALFIEFLLSVTLPARNGFESFLFFVPVSRKAQKEHSTNQNTSRESQTFFFFFFVFFLLPFFSLSLF